MSLSIRNKVGFIDGTVTKPTDDSEDKLKAWSRCNTIVMSWMMHSVSPEFKSMLLYVKTAVEGWQKLKTRYAQPNDLRIFQLQQEIYKVSQGNSSVTDYFSKLSSLWEELGDYRPIPSCVCKECTCYISDVFEKMHDIN